MVGSNKRSIACLGLAALMMGSFVGQASALTARHLRGNQRGGYHHHHYRHYGNPAVGRAVAGVALGIIGLAAGAAAANAYDRDDDYGPGYGYAPYGYGYGPY